MSDKPHAIIAMKVGPHSGMSLSEIISSKKEEERIHGCHYWGYSGVFCRPRQTQQFCQMIYSTYNEYPQIILIETKSAYRSSIGFIKHFSINGEDFCPFNAPVQLQGAQFSFVAKNIKEIDRFRLSDYAVFGGKNDGKQLNQHLRFRVNKAFAVLDTDNSEQPVQTEEIKVLSATLVPPFAIWLRE